LEFSWELGSALVLKVINCGEDMSKFVIKSSGKTVMLLLPIKMLSPILKQERPSISSLRNKH